MGSLWSVQGLQVGDEVAFCWRGRGGGWMQFSVAKVARITKTRVILDNGRRFNMDGKEVKSEGVDFPSHYLYEAAYAYTYMEKKEAQIALNNRVNKLLDLLKGKRSGWGNYHLTDSEAELVEALCVAMEDKSNEERNEESGTSNS